MSSVGPNLGALVDGSYGENVYFETLRLYRTVDCLVQPTAISLTTFDAPSLPNDGDTYIVPELANGEWSSAQNKVARWSSRIQKWEYFTPQNGWEFYIRDTDSKVRFNGTEWFGCGIVVSNIAPQDSDGRPNGTVYFQTR